MNPLFDAVDFGLILVDDSGQVVSANRWVRERCRPTPLAEGVALAQAFQQPVEPRLLLAVRSCLDLGNASRLSQAFHPMPLPLFQPRDGQAERLRQAVDLIPVLDGATPPGRRCLIQVRDVTESVRREQLFKSQARRLSQELARLTQAHQEIERQSARFREMTRLATVGLFETDLAGELTFCNTRVGELLAVDALALLRRPWTDLFTPHCRDVQAKHEAWLASASSGVRFVAEFCLERPEPARPTWVRVETSPLRHGDTHQLHGHLFTLVDVTELREQARRNELRANHDKLTGLVNRDRFEGVLVERLQRLEQRQPGAELTVMFIDLDRFKQVNDGHGHHAGDLVLRTVATRLRRCVRAHDVVARLGGDEFAVLLGDPLEFDLVARVATRIEKAVAMPINVGSGHVAIGASIGWASADGIAPSLSANRMLQAADAAMYRSKRQRLAPMGTAAASADTAATASTTAASTVSAQPNDTTAAASADALAA